jgi:hypothetical protein
MRFLRYFIGGFEALLALMALGGFGAGLIAFVHFNLPPGVGVHRLVNVRMGGFILSELIAAAIFGPWFGRLAVRNFRDARVKVSEGQSRK